MDIMTLTFMYTNKIVATIMGILLLSATAGCSNTVVKTTEQAPLNVTNEQIAEHQLLDVGVVVFDPGLDSIEDSTIPVFIEIRRAESHYFPVQLMEAMQTSASWGAVRVVPTEEAAVDLTVKGKILQSDGERIELHITAHDSSGNQWLDKKYKQVASQYSYKKSTGIKHDPFVGTYNNIANDLRKIKQKLDDQELIELRALTELKFARDFSPEAFDAHIDTNKKGEYTIKRLPATNDPMFDRIREIRERDYLFVDTLQEYYGAFVREMEAPYGQWRGQSYDEVLQLRELRRQSTNRTVAGIASIIGGVLAAGSSNGSARAAGQIGVVGGGYLIKEGFNKRAGSKLHVEALQELGDSLEAEVEPHFFELEDRTITLTGTVENQYQQWRKLLKELYKIETGGITDSASE